MVNSRPVTPDTNPDLPPQGRFVDREHRFPVRVYFEDTDAAGIVYYANYLRFMERARSEMLRAVGVDQAAALGEGVYAVAEAHVRYRSPARLDDALVVRSVLTAIRAAACVIHQRVTRGDVLCAEADITAAFISPEGRPKRQPKAWVEKFEGLLA